MTSSVFFGGSVVAAVVAGSIALFAPCCISVMLPAYFASSFQNYRRLVAMTFVFGIGIATVILPLALGANALREVVLGQHTAIYVAGGVLMLALAGFTLLGGQIHLPMPGRSAGGATGPLSVYSLGVFSGVATSCCAPVLAGVIALSGLASSFLVALGLGGAYVFGMLAPLFLISVLWDRYDWQAHGLFRPRTVRWHLGPVSRTIGATSLASGLLLAVMGVAMIWVGVQGNSMPAPSAWQTRIAVQLQHYGKLAVDAIAWVPGWAAALLLLVVVALLARLALHQVIGEHQPPQIPHSETPVEQQEA